VCIYKVQVRLLPQDPAGSAPERSSCLAYWPVCSLPLRQVRLASFCPRALFAQGPPRRVIPLLPPPFPIRFYIFFRLCFLRVQKRFSKRKRKGKTKKKRKGNTSSAVFARARRPPLLRPCLHLRSSHPPLSSPPIVPHCSAPHLSRLSSHPPASLRFSIYFSIYFFLLSFFFVFCFFFFFFLFSHWGSVMLLRQVCQCSPACV
jgi:hypothetical protein